MSQVVSYEKLADTSLRAALELRRADAPNAEFAHLAELVAMLRAPVDSDADYKLLTDARNIAIYRAAWEEAFGAESKLKPDAFLTKLSGFLSKSIETNGRPRDSHSLYEFCLALNRLFLEKSANRLLYMRTGTRNEFA